MSSGIAEKLKAEGWTVQFSASGHRLAEAIENYRMLGLEVKTVPMAELQCGECTICFEDESDRSVMIFTRKSGAAVDNDLFDELDEEAGS
ncbi:MAG: hypothetical protein ACE5FH_07670 [Candidatus Zixiibacteriota bacterium]